MSSSPADPSQPCDAPADPRPASLHGHLDRLVATTLERCTTCGKCLEACPMPAYSETLGAARAADAPAVVTGVLDVLRNRPGSPAALEWIGLCTQSARCIQACPEGVDPMLMLRVARMSAFGQRGGEQQLAPKEDKQFFRRIHALSALQLTEDEIDRWQR